MSNKVPDFANQLKKLKQQDLYRKTVVYDAVGGKIKSGDRKLLNFSSNDYLNFATHPRIIGKAREYLEKYGSGATASRLVVGSLDCHQQFEQQFAEFKGYSAALLFGSGYLANLGSVTAVVGRHDSIYADRLIHASLIDACLLSRAKLQRYRHNDLEQLEQLLKKSHSRGRRLLVTEAVFSMDGDQAPLEQLSYLAEKYDCLLLVDEAHSTGIFGSCGAGLVAEKNLTDRVDITVSTLSKALGSYGGVVATSQQVKELLINRARSFIYSTALPPASIGAAEAALEILQSTADLGERLLRRATVFKTRLEQAGLTTANSQSQIVPLIVGENSAALELADKLKEEGIVAVAIRPPTVPRGQARIRFSLSLAHSKEVIKKLAETVIEKAAEVGLV